MPVSDDGQIWFKQLSANDVGETGGHQAGPYIFKDDYGFFGDIDTEEPVSSKSIEVEDRSGGRYTWWLNWYKSKGELHLTHCTSYFHRFGIISGDVLDLQRIGKDTYSVDATGSGTDSHEETVFTLDTTEIASGKRPVGQGFAKDAKRRQATEDRAMKVAIEQYQNEGWAVEDVSSGSPFDLFCKNDGTELHVEVKGTTGDGKSVFLTRNEVDHAHSYPNVHLFIVSNIVLEETDGEWAGSEGDVRIIPSWEPASDDLSALSYEYSVPESFE